VYDCVCVCVLQVRQVIRGEKLRTLRVVGVDDVNAKIEPEVVRTLTPIDKELNELNGILGQLQQENDKRQVGQERVLTKSRVGYSKVYFNEHVKLVCK